jgi:hypothetical protein
MLYLWPSSNAPEDFGVITTPAFGGVNISIKQGRTWAMDSGLFGGSFSLDGYLKFIKKHKPYRDTCLFVTVPDSVGNSIQTLHLWRNHVWLFEGWPLAFVAQDGQENLPMPVDYDVLFLGGSTDWKLSPAADDCIARGQAAGRWIHIGRTNSEKRMDHFKLVGANSCDGTFPAREPDTAERRLRRAMKQPPLLRMP